MRRSEVLWTVGISTSLFGDSALALAFVVWLKHLTGSPAQAGLAFFASFAPTLLAPGLGLIADRVRRARLLIIADIAMAAWILLALLVHSRGQAWIIYLVLIGLGVGTCIQSSATSALLADVIPPERRTRVNAVFRTAKDVALFAAPAGGVLIYNWLGPAAVIGVDIATYLVSIFSVMQLRAKEEIPRREPQRLATELSAGIRHITTTPVLRRVIVAIAACLLAFGMFEPVSIEVSAVRGAGHANAFLGIMLTVKSLGSILGGAACARWGDRLSPLRLVICGLLLMGGGTLVLLAGLDPVILAGCVIVGAGAALGLIGFLTCIQLNTPARLQGRVFAAADTSIRVPQAVAMAVGSGLITLAPYQSLLAVMAAVTLVSAITLALVQSRQPAPTLSTVERA